MLVLSRRVQEEILIDGNITITIVRIERDKIRIGISAPKDVPIVRGELLDRAEEVYGIEGVPADG